MRRIKNPRQIELYDPFAPLLSPMAVQRLQAGWQGVFRHAILELLPADALAEHFDPVLGRPTKELYSAAGLVFIMGFQNWTAEQAADAYMFDVGLQYALNLEPALQEMSSRTVERYQRIFREDELAAGVFERVTGALVKSLHVCVARQRLDSTHVFSNMAVFGRTQLMGVAIKRFLTQVLRHDREGYDALPEAMRQRYASSTSRLFGDTSRDAESRKRLRQEVAEEMHFLIERFADSPVHKERTAYKALVRIFFEQCEVAESRVQVKEKAGSRVMQNPSDPDATYDGKKGSGFQVQLSETCGEENEVQLITAALPQTAADTDPESYGMIQQTLAQTGRLPQQLLADAAYGSDENVEMAKAAAVELLSPVNSSKRNPGKLHADDFLMEAATETVLACPAGHAPLESVYDAERNQTSTRFDASACGQCPLRAQCPVSGKHTRTFVHTPAQRRGAQRLRHEQSPEFRKAYAKRAGIEGTMSRLKRCLALGRLRVRGKPAVFTIIFLKLAGWNIRQAAKAMRGQIANMVQKASENTSNPEKAATFRMGRSGLAHCATIILSIALQITPKNNLCPNPLKQCGLLSALSSKGD